jgi:large subunit ribosomal protein L9
MPSVIMYIQTAVAFHFLFFTRLIGFASAAPTTHTREATFIAPASPTVTRSSKNIPITDHLTYARSQVISSGYGLYSSTRLHAKKNKAAPAAAKKIQVKLLKYVAGSGSIGEVILVTPAFFNNKLRPTKSAEIISDEEVAEQESIKQEKEDKNKAKATEMQEQLIEITLQLKRKAGPDGQLFGGIGPKTIMTELQAVVNDSFLDQKWVKIAEVLDENGKKIRGDIKYTGDFGARIALLSGISAKIGITVEAE